MAQNYGLLCLLRRYLDRLDDLGVVREYVTLRLGEVDDELIDYVSMEIWCLEDGLVTEDDLRTRLAALLEETKSRVVSFGVD